MKTLEAVQKIGKLNKIINQNIESESTADIIRLINLSALALKYSKGNDLIKLSEIEAEIEMEIEKFDNL